MEWPVSFAVLVALAIVVEGFRAVSRRQFVEQWAHERNLTIESCRYAFFPFSANWLVTYRVRLVDSGGRRLEGTAYATGFVRKRAWVDFEGPGEEVGDAQKCRSSGAGRRDHARRSRKHRSTR